VSALSLDAVVVRRAEPLSAVVDDELVMLDPRQSRYFGLDRVGRRVWDLIEEPISVGALCAVLQDEFDVAPDVCRADVLAFLERMDVAELVEVR
jgi:hypothetical protein